MNDTIITGDINVKNIDTLTLYNILDTLIFHNKKVPCIKIILQELCLREFKSNTIGKNHKRLINYAKYFLLRDEIRSIFHDFLIQDNINYDILSWLDQNNVIYIEEYWATKPTTVIIEQLKKYISSFVDNLFTSENEQIDISRNIFLKLVLAANSQTSSNWFNRLKNIYNDFLVDALNEFIFNYSDCKLIGFVKVLNTDLSHSNMIKYNNKKILQTLLSYREKEKLTIFDVIEKQEMWAAKLLNPRTLDLHFELIKLFSFGELFELFQEIPEEKINFRVLLLTVAVYINKVPDSYKNLKSLINRTLHSLFTEKTNEYNNFNDESLLLFLISMIRQACLEFTDPESLYSEWFVSTFGSDSVLRSGSHIVPWVLLLGALRTALPREPLWVLRVHSQKNLRAPVMYNRDAQGYKEACRKNLNRKIKYCCNIVNKSTNLLIFCSLIDHIHKLKQCIFKWNT